MTHPTVDQQAALVALYAHDWVGFARDILGVSLDPQQNAILHSCQVNRRTAVKSGHARGKDFTAAVAGLCHLYTRYPSKVICTGPTGRQVRAIMMSESKRVWKKARIPLGGRFLDTRIVFDAYPDWYLLGFKAEDNAIEAWTGFHSPHLFVVVTEASGIPDLTYQAIEGLLTGDSRVLLVMNPNRTSGEAYAAFKSPLYEKFTLSCLDAPNVRAGKVIIPGQVDRAWIDALIQKPGWVAPISLDAANPDDGDFWWGSGKSGRWYRPGDLFRVKVLGQWPREAEDQLIPLAWVEAAQARWAEWRESGASVDNLGDLALGVDVAGMGSDMTVFCHRYGDLVTGMEVYSRLDHMAAAGRIKTTLGERSGRAYVDVIGEGAGVFSRLQETETPVVPVKFSEGAKGLSDLTGERRFRNIRAYCYWAIRDALDPQLGGKLAIPPLDELTQDLTAQTYRVGSDGLIILDDKETVIKPRLGRSPDYSDALANTYYPRGAARIVENALEGVGIW